MGLVSTYMTSGFDFEGEQDKSQRAGQIIVVGVISILMLNLLVGVLSEKLGDVVANKTISSNRILLENCITYETLKGLFYCKKE
jgi:hypothetical protein